MGIDLFNFFDCFSATVAELTLALIFNFSQVRLDHFHIDHGVLHNDDLTESFVMCCFYERFLVGNAWCRILDFVHKVINCLQTFIVLKKHGYCTEMTGKSYASYWLTELSPIVMYDSGSSGIDKAKWLLTYWSLSTTHACKVSKSVKVVLSFSWWNYNLPFID